MKRSLGNWEGNFYSWSWKLGEGQREDQLVEVGVEGGGAPELEQDPRLKWRLHINFIIIQSAHYLGHKVMKRMLQNDETRLPEWPIGDQRK